jgi:Arc/MetJ-type ribon-helix-helix transcriptional regulator
MTEAKKRKISLQLTESTIEKWDEAVQEGQSYGTRTDLIRQSVAKELAGGHGQSGRTNERELREIKSNLEGLEIIQRRLDDVERQLGEIRQEVKHDPELSDLASAVFQHLPREPSNEDVEYRLGDGYYLIPESKSVMTGEIEPIPFEDVGSDRRLAETGRIEAFAHVLDEKVQKIERAIEKLQKDTHTVGETDDGRYHRRE